MVSRAGISMILLVMAGLLLTVACRAESRPSASVDRAEIRADETLTLILSIQGQLSPVGPDLSPLRENFDVLANRQSSRHSIIDGRRESTTEWRIELAPRHAGVLTIPALEVADGRTEPLSIMVLPATSRPARTDNRPVYVEAEVDRTAVHVQQQILFTVRIFQAVELDDMNITEPAFDHASVRKVNQTRYQRQVGGLTYRVHELTYAIFPQQTGELIIPELLFSARQPTGRRSMFSLGSSVAVRDMTPQITVDVSPPASDQTPWLPARSVELREQWRGDPSQLSVGESITRRIELVADGQPAAHLPELKLSEPDGVRFFADQPDRNDVDSAEGVRGTLVQSVAMVPTAAGEIVLPALKVQWWNTTTGRQETAELPARTLRVAPAAGSAKPPLPVESAAEPGVRPTIEDAAASLWPWQLATGVLAVLWLATLGLWWSSRRTRRGAGSDAPDSSGPRDGGSAIRSEASAWRALKRAAHSNDPAATRRALLQWARLRWPDRHLARLDDLVHQSGSSELAAAIRELQARLYGEPAERGEAGREQVWRGQALVDVLDPLRVAEAGRDDRASPLPPLNP